jgi:hypothetical protein
MTQVTVVNDHCHCLQGVVLAILLMLSKTNKHEQI